MQVLRFTIGNPLELIGTREISCEPKNFLWLDLERSETEHSPEPDDLPPPEYPIT